MLLCVLCGEFRHSLTSIAYLYQPVSAQPEALYHPVSR